MNKIIKKGFLYASIGLFVIGGWGVWSAKSVYAYNIITFTDSPGYSDTASWTGFQNYVCSDGYIIFQHDWTGYYVNVPVNIGGCLGRYPALVTMGTSYGDYSSGIACVDQNGTNDEWNNVDLSLCSNLFIPEGGEINFYNTHFINTSPISGTTTATTSSVGANIYANGQDFPNYGRVHVKFTQDSAFACQNSGAVYDAIYTCSGDNLPASPIEIDFSTTTLNKLISGIYNLSQEVTFGGGGKWTGEFTIDQVSSPWYFFGLFNTYTTLVSTTTHFTVGQLSPMDIAREAIQEAQAEIASSTAHGIGAILASTTASWKDACNLFSGFNIGDCLTLTIWPGTSALADDLLIIKQTPPWGYVFRVIDILNATTSTTTLPKIDYSFASTSPMSIMGNIHFDPFGTLTEASVLINEMHSDRASGATVWTILMPVVNIFIYMVLFFMIIHDLTGIHRGDEKIDHDKKIL